MAKYNRAINCDKCGNRTMKRSSKVYKMALIPMLLLSIPYLYLTQNENGYAPGSDLEGRFMAIAVFLFIALLIGVNVYELYAPNTPYKCKVCGYEKVVTQKVLTKGYKIALIIVGILIALFAISMAALYFLFV